MEVRDFATNTYFSVFPTYLKFYESQKFLECVLVTNLLMTYKKVFSRVISKQWEGKMWSEGAGDAGKDDSILLLKFNFFSHDNNDCIKYCLKLQLNFELFRLLGIYIELLAFKNLPFSKF